MSQCNVEFFDLKTMECVYNDVIDTPEIDDDRLALSSTEIYVGATYVISKHDIVHITGAIEFFGVVAETPVPDTFHTVVSVLPFVALFDHEAMFETGYQKTGKYASRKVGLEYYMAHVIDLYHINTRDDDQEAEIPSLRFLDNLNNDNTKYTREWDLGLQPPTEDSSLSVVSFFSDVVVSALSSYGIAINAKPNFNEKKIDLSISPGSEHPLVIDADSPAVQIVEFYVDSASADINKLEIWNEANTNERVYYYLYTDKTYGTDKDPKDKERVYPCVTAVRTAAPVTDSYDESQNKTFAKAAEEVAEREFAQVQWNNSIELSFLKNDPNVKPMGIPIGQTVKIIHDGSEYTTILTGRRLGPSISLIFGTVRLELTKQLQLK